AVRKTQACTAFEANEARKTRFRQGSLSFPQAIWPPLETRYRECEQNTRCCGLRLTCTIDSGIFSSAAVNGF
ncbi:MAG: hypothetical protein WCA11_05775, partial [Terracidiphilus sp.]